ncbi:MAG: hypothetical protein AB7S97_03775 [Thermoplasmata archaeon]
MRKTMTGMTLMPRLTEPLSTAVALLAGAADLVMVTLLVAWALEDIIYFSLFVGIPVGIVSAVLVFLLLRMFLRKRHEGDST